MGLIRTEGCPALLKLGPNSGLLEFSESCALDPSIDKDNAKKMMQLNIIIFQATNPEFGILIVHFFLPIILPTSCAAKYMYLCIC